MKHYTLIIFKPEGDLLPRLVNNSKFRKGAAKDQWILWDGPASQRDILNLYETISPYCSGISLTSGSKEVQKHVRSQGKFQ